MTPFLGGNALLSMALAANSLAWRDKARRACLESAAGQPLERRMNQLKKYCTPCITGTRQSCRTEHGEDRTRKKLALGS